ncbi:MAG: DUF4167 domain-containing protein [Pseudomonadota bacterium]
MRSSKNRSRSKGNRNRSVGNIVNRVFDSSGPEGKVRGTPQQIIDKYNQLARDAHLSNDRVAAENFQQHAEYYTRLLSDAQREMEARRDAQEAQQQQQRRDRQSDGRPDEPRAEGEPPATASPSPPEANGFDEVIDSGANGGSADIVETPEEAPRAKRPRRPRRNGAAKADGDAGTDATPDTGAESQPPEAAE